MWSLAEIYSRHQHYEKPSDQSDEQRTACLDTAELQFIDEGFGSLDPEVLNVAIASLDLP